MRVSQHHTPDAPTDDPSHSWDFIPGFEPSDAYEAFAHYRDLGAKRTLTRCARDLGIGPGTVVRWARLYLWADRVQSYDTHRAAERERLRAIADADADAKWADVRKERLEQLNELADLGAAQLIHRLRTRRGEMRPNELVQITRLLMHFGNLANGDATEKVDGLPDLSNMSDEQLTAYREAVSLVRAHRSKSDDGDESE